MIYTLSHRLPTRHLYSLLVVTLGAILVSAFFVFPLPHSYAASSQASIRLNQVGYITNETKQAIVMASAAEKGATFNIINVSTGKNVYTGSLGSSLGSWSSSFPDTYLLDFSSIHTPGSYYIQLSGPINATSPTFHIDSGSALYSSLLSNALFFYQTQRDGANVNAKVMDRQPSHLTDQQASIYKTPTYSNDVLQGSLTKIGGPIDVSGGWFDAGDYVKFVETASYTDAIMLIAARQYPSLFTGGSADFNAEGKYGLDWLQKMWNNTSKTLYYQVGIGDGNGSSILGDHDIWRLPQADDALNTKPGDSNYYIKYRPVFQAGSAASSISPNLAGRLAADFGLCYQLYHVTDPTYANQCLINGENIFDLAKTSNVGQLLTVSPYDYYPETEWRDDLELGATELYYATSSGSLPSGLKHSDPNFYLQAAAKWAHAYITGPNDAADSLNLYDVSGLAHYELYKAITQAGNPPGLAVTQSDLLNDLNKQLTNGTTQAKSDPFGFGIAYAGGDAAPHALGYALEADFIDELAGSSTFRSFGLTQRNWALGSNAWGSSFIVGAGSTFPICMQHQIANLAGSLNGTSPIVLGATVDGPSDTSNFSGLSLQDGMRACPTTNNDPFKAFTGHNARYYDNVVAWPSVEPADDYTALTILLFAHQVSAP